MIRRLGLAALLSLGLSISPWADGYAAAPPSRPLAFSQFDLPNGLKVLVHEDHTVPLVAVEVFYHVGSKDEAPGKTGFAHLFEHLMFKGSRNVPDGGHFQAVIEAGGMCNATTNRDRTNYFDVVPASFLERALFLEADRMHYLLDGVTQQKLDNQRDVVRNERRQNYENRPYGLAVRALVEAVFPTGHPYHWLTIGDHADLERATLADVQAFFRAHYRPGNATLAVAGDVDPATVKQLVEKHFGPIPSDPNAPTAPPSPARRDRPASRPAPQLTTEKRVDLEDAVSLERLTLAWPSPAAFEPGDADLDLLTSVLGPSSGRLHRRLVHELQIAQSVSIGQSSGLLASTFEITVTMKPGHTAAEAVPVIDEELHKLRDGTQPVTPVELEAARMHVESDLWYSIMPLMGVHGGRTDRMLYYDYFARDPDFLDRDLVRYRAVTADSIAATLRALGPGRVRIVVHPKDKRAEATPQPAPKSEVRR